MTALLAAIVILGSVMVVFGVRATRQSTNDLERDNAEWGVAFVAALTVLALTMLLSSRANAAIVIPFAFTAPPAVAPDSATVHLTWTAPYDNSGFLAAYDFEIDGNVFRSALAPHAPGSAEAASFTVYDSTLFRVRALDAAGNLADWSNPVKAGPGGAAYYRAVWHEWNGGVQQMSAWGGPRGFADGLRVPRAEGQPDTVWIVKSQASRTDGYLTVERMNGTASGRPVYVGHFALGFRPVYEPTPGPDGVIGTNDDGAIAVPDTLVGWVRDDGRLVRWVDSTTVVQPDFNFLLTTFQYTGPTLLPYGSETARIWTQSQIQWALRERLCELFGFWISAGEVQPCQ